MGLKPLKIAKTRQKQKKGNIGGIFGENPPFFGPKSCVFEIALVSLVGVRTYEIVLRPTQNPTLAGMDPLWTLVPIAETTSKREATKIQSRPRY